MEIFDGFCQKQPVEKTLYVTGNSLNINMIQEAPYGEPERLGKQGNNYGKEERDEKFSRKWRSQSFC